MTRQPMFEGLESRRLFAAVFAGRINFQPSNVPVPDYCKADTGAVFGLRANGLTYGWNALNTLNTRDRNSALSYDQRYDTFNHMQKGGSYKWEIAVPNGQYKVRVVAGDASYADSVMKINIENTLAVNGTPTRANPWVEGTVTVNVSDGRLTVSNAAGAVNNKICFIEIGESMITSTPAPNPTQGTLTWTKAASHIARTEEMVATVNGKMYVMGGYVNNSYLSVARMDTYDPATNKWTQLPDMPVKLSHAATVVDGRYIILVGGYGVNAAGTKQVFGQKTVYRYDTQTGKWGTLQPLPVNRGAGNMVLLDRTLYYMGGFDEKMGDRTEIYTLKLDDPAARWTLKGNMPGPNNHFGIATLNGKIYTIGGQTGNDATAVFKRTSFRYDPATGGWTALALFGDPARSHIWATTIVYKGKILIFGGETRGVDNNHPRTVQAVESYDPAADKWSLLTKLPAARSSGVVSVFGDKIVFSTGLAFGTFMSDTWIGEFK